MRCLLIAPSDADTSGVELVLEERDVSITRTTQLGSGADLATAELDDVDFAVVIFIIEQSKLITRGMTAVYVEAGIVLGKGLPLFVISVGTTAVPAALARLPSATLDLSDIESLRLHLGLFVRGLTGYPSDPVERKRQVGGSLSPESVSQYREWLNRARVGRDAPEYEDLVFDVLTAAGAVAERSTWPDRGADGAFVVPGEESLGYVLFEIKASASLNARSLRSAQNVLQAAVIERRGALGLLLFDVASQPTADLATTPLVVALSLEQFLEELGRKPLASVVRSARNEAVHRL